MHDSAAGGTAWPVTLSALFFLARRSHHTRDDLGRNRAAGKVCRLISHEPGEVGTQLDARSEARSTELEPKQTSAPKARYRLQCSRKQ